MSKYNRNSYPYKNYDYYLPQRIGPGALPNDRLTACIVCSQNGYPHEAVIIRAKKLVNYHDGSGHIHKQVLDDPAIWAVLWSLT